MAESFFSSLKQERIKKRIYKTRDMARADIFNYIEMSYNPVRRHSHLGGVNPEAFETASFLGNQVSCERGKSTVTDIECSDSVVSERSRVSSQAIS